MSMLYSHGGQTKEKKERKKERKALERRKQFLFDAVFVANVSEHNRIVALPSDT